MACTLSIAIIILSPIFPMFSSYFIFCFIFYFIGINSIYNFYNNTYSRDFCFAPDFNGTACNILSWNVIMASFFDDLIMFRKFSTSSSLIFKKKIRIVCSKISFSMYLLSIPYYFFFFWIYLMDLWIPEINLAWLIFNILLNLVS